MAGGADGILEGRGLGKSFHGRPALVPVDLAIREGEHLALTGPSGSGKTTLLRLLAGLLEPSQGMVLEDGQVVNRPGWRLLPHRRRIGMLFQELALWPHMTVRQQVEFSMPRQAAPSRRQRRLASERILEQAGLQRLAARYPSDLSGGERQRVAWVRAVAGSPRLLFLDEPLTSLDPAMREDLLRAILDYGKLPGRTVVVVTHDPQVAERVGERVLRLPAGI